MITVTTTQQITIHGGLLALSKDQAARRAHLLRKTGTKFQVILPVNFKVGETFGMESVPKDMEKMVRVQPGKNIEKV